MSIISDRYSGNGKVQDRKRHVRAAFSPLLTDLKDTGSVKEVRDRPQFAQTTGEWFVAFFFKYLHCVA